MEDKIMNEIRENMSMCEKEFQELNRRIGELENEIQKHITRREQVRGQYTAYYNLLNKENSKIEEGEKSVAVSDDSLQSETKESSSKEAETNEDKKTNGDKKPNEDKKTNKGENIDLKKIVEKANKESKSSKLDDDIPDYLKG